MEGYFRYTIINVLREYTPDEWVEVQALSKRVEASMAALNWELEEMRNLGIVDYSTYRDLPVVRLTDRQRIALQKMASEAGADRAA